MSFYNTHTKRNFKLHYGQPPNGVPDDTLVHNWSFNSVATNDLTVDNCNIHLGTRSGAYRQATGSIAIGCYAGETMQGASSSDDDVGYAIAIGHEAGRTSQYGQCIAIGYQAGQIQQGNGISGDSDDTGCIAIGYRAGQSNQGGSSGDSIAIGSEAGNVDQHGNCIAIGARAGCSNQDWDGIAIGHYAGENNQGTYAIAIGRGAGTNSQASNSIVLNAGGGVLDTSNGSGFYVRPIRGVAWGIGAGRLYYDAGSNEITYSTN